MTDHRKKTIAGALVLLLFLCGCRKGDDDPAFTLASRIKRLKGEWILQTADVSVKYDQHPDGLRDFDFSTEEGQFTVAFYGDSTEVFRGPYELRLGFDTEGKMKVEENLNNYDYRCSGTWDFLGKGAGYKNKERLMLFTQKVEAGASNEFHPLFSTSIHPVYAIRELSKYRLTMSHVSDDYGVLLNKTIKVTVRAEFVFIE